MSLLHDKSADKIEADKRAENTTTLPLPLLLQLPFLFTFTLALTLTFTLAYQLLLFGNCLLAVCLLFAYGLLMFCF